ncbi:MAG: YqgE/AlgH family protein [Acidimicrobiales bacterium]
MSGPVTSLAAAPGRLLVATPVIDEPIFFRTVIGLLEHDDDVGTLGVVLNRPGELLVHEAIPRWSDAAGLPPVLFRGGPVAESSALALAALPGSGPGSGQSPPARSSSGEAEPQPEPEPADPVSEGLTPLFEGLAVLDLDRDPALILPWVARVRFYHGYAGWGPRQLQGELRAGAWWVLPSMPMDWFSETPTMLWGQVLARLGGSWTMWANAPEDPSVN